MLVLCSETATQQHMSEDPSVLAAAGEDGGVDGLELTDGRVVEGDLYVSAMQGACAAYL